MCIQYSLYKTGKYYGILHRYNEYFSDESNPIPTYSKIEKTINCKFEDNTEFPDIHATGKMSK